MSLYDFMGIKEPKKHFLPQSIQNVKVPPIKCQGIKTQLINFISMNVKWSGDGTFYEPFMGSGVVSFNINPKKVVMSDNNPHIINFYNAIKKGEINQRSAQKFFRFHGHKLSLEGKSYYYEMRDKFNEDHDPLYFLFLNRSCFNGLIRFNQSGKFNSSFCKKPNRFSKSYISKIVNQILWVRKRIKNGDYTFILEDWKDVLSHCKDEDFIYFDPPYLGRYSDYFNTWEEEDQSNLFQWLLDSHIGFALSLWYENEYRKNDIIDEVSNEFVIRKNTHYYFIGSTEENRKKMEEALIIRKGYETKKEARVIQKFENYT